MSILRQKRTLTIFCLMSILVYINWFINVRKFETVQTYIETQRLNIKPGPREKIVNLNNPNGLGQDYEPTKPLKNLEEINKQTLIEVFSVFHSNKVCLLDVGVLKNISQLLNTSNLKYDLLKVLNLDRNPERSSFLTFGIGYLKFGSLQKELVKSFGSRCNVGKKLVKNNNVNIPTALYVECRGLMLQICVIYRRGSFLWIPANGISTINHKVFGDLTRAIQKFDLKEITDDDLKMYIPADLDKFFFDYGHSRFIECNKQLARYNLKSIGSKYRQNEKKNKMIAPVIQHITQTLESMGKHYWLAGGTLLGWYRDCGIIPFTQDVDIALWFHEYDQRIKEKFLGNEIVRVWSTLGLVNDSFEFRLFNDAFTFDMFLVYEFNLTDQWCGYQVNRTKYRRFLPRFDKLCSAELLSQKLLVPCEPEAYLEKEYGSKRWRTPLAKNYQWDNVKYWTNWTENEWIHTVRYYDRHGKLIKNKTREHLNKFLSFNLSSSEFDRLLQYE